MTTTIDLAPFGFTTTESRVYAVLLHLGPATGYAVARTAHLARANAYGALDGLVTRGAATKTAERPARYRPSDPQALMAQLAAQQGEALERLSRALEQVAHHGEPATRALDGARALANVVLQTVARAERRVEGIVSPAILGATLPAWRRAAERAELAVAASGETPPHAASFVTKNLPEGLPTLLLVDDRQIVAVAPDSPTGIWSSHPALVAVARVAISQFR